MNRNLFARGGRIAQRAFSIGVVATMIAGCGAGSSSSTSLAGSLAQTQSFEQLHAYVERFINPVRRPQLQDAVGGLKCTTSANPPVTVSGTVSSAGSFSIDLSSVAGQPLTCALTDAGGTVLGTFVFTDSTSAGLGGGALSMDTVAFTGAHTVGTVSISGGTITVDAGDANIPVTGASVTAATAFDPTGIWTISAPSFTLPPGYIAPCPAGTLQCNGPNAGQTLFINRVAGKVFTPGTACAAAIAAGTWDGTSCAGTTGSGDAFALTIWNSQAAENACGSAGTPALGFTNLEAEAHGNIDFSSNAGILTQVLNWTSPSAPLVNGWEATTTATSNYTMQDCQNVVLSDGSTNAWKCFDASGNYSLSIGGGCVDGSGNPVNTQQMLGSPSGACTNGTVVVAGITLNTNSCPFNYTPSGGSLETITCGGSQQSFKSGGAVYTNVNTTGTFTNLSTTLTITGSAAGIAIGQGVFSNDVPFNTVVTNVVGTAVTLSNAATITEAGAFVSFGFAPTNLITQGAACSTAAAGPAGDLAAAECYANYYYQTFQNASSGCVQRINTNWSATDAADFIQFNSPPQASTEQVLEKLIYFDDNHAAMTQIQDNYPGVSAPGNTNSSWVPCHTRQTASIKITNLSGHATPVSGDQMLISFVQETHLLADAESNPVCSNAAAGGNQNLTGTERVMFVMTHQ